MSIENRLGALQLKLEELLVAVGKNGKDAARARQGQQLDLFSVQEPPPALLSAQAEIRTLQLWRCVVAECLGTLFLVFLICGACIPWTGHFPPFLTIAFATALAYGALAYRVFPGSHLNPAFTLALAAVKRISVLRFLLFLVAQAGGAIAGTAILYGLTVPGYQGILGGTSVASHVNPWQACGLEFILCLMMTLTFLLDPTDCFSTTSVLLVANLVALPCTGAGLNPVRSLGPAFVMNKWPNHWVFWLGPLLGSVTAAYLHAFILHRRRKVDKLRENPSDGDSLDIPAVEMPNSNGIPESVICERFEPLYGGTRSLYMKPSPVLARQNLHRSQSVYASGRRFDFPTNRSEVGGHTSGKRRSEKCTDQHQQQQRHFETASDYEPIYERKPPTGGNTAPLILSGPPSYDSNYFSKTYDSALKSSASANSHHNHNHHKEKNEIIQQRERDRERERENHANRLLAQYEGGKGGLVDIDPKLELKRQQQQQQTSAKCFYESEQSSTCSNSKRSSQLDNLERKLLDSCSESESHPPQSSNYNHHHHRQRSNSSHHSTNHHHQRYPQPPPRIDSSSCAAAGAKINGDLGRGNYVHEHQLNKGRHEARKPYDYVDPKKLVDIQNGNNDSSTTYSPRLLLGDKDCTYSRILEPLLNSKSAGASPVGHVVVSPPDNAVSNNGYHHLAPTSADQFTYSYH